MVDAEIGWLKAQRQCETRAVTLRLPDQTVVDDLMIRRWTVEDAPAMHTAITANIDHLRPRMAWIAAEPLTLGVRRELIAGWTSQWGTGGDEVMMGIWQGGEVVGSTGLHQRGWPDGLEIGFWVTADRQGEGIATRVTAALVDLVFTETNFASVYLANDVENLASRRIPEKLGFTHLGRFPTDRALAPADTGVDDRWRKPRPPTTFEKQ